MAAIRCPASIQDGDPLTGGPRPVTLRNRKVCRGDGLGIFTANAAYERRPRPNGRGTQPLARGYLRETALAEALAYYAWLRDERHPEWDRHLDPPVRRVMRNHLNVLCR